MADDVTVPNVGVVATDKIGGVDHQRVKVQYGEDGSATDVSDTNPFPVDDAGGSLTVDNAALSVTGGGVEASALRVTLANNSTGTLAQLPASLGQKTKANSMGVTIASDQNAVPVYTASEIVASVFDYKNTVGTATETISATSKRIRIKIQNVHATDAVYIGDDSGVSSTTGWRLNTGETLELTDATTTLYAKPAGTGVNLRIIEEISI